MLDPHNENKIDLGRSLWQQHNHIQRHLSCMQTWSIHRQFPNMDSKQKREMRRFTSQRSSKFIVVNMIDGLSLAIFANNGIYIAITLFVKMNMLIQNVLTFHKIILPFSFINSMNFKNSRCLFGLWKKKNTRTAINLL